MIYSMTGYGKSEVTIDHLPLTIEIKSLNGKNSEVNLRCPNYIKSKEIEIKKAVSEQLIRGKIDVTITEQMGENMNTPWNEQLIDTYIIQLKKIAHKHDLVEDDILSALMRIPDLFQSNKEIDIDKDWELLIKALSQATDELTKFRIQEGKYLMLDIAERLSAIQSNLIEIEQKDKDRIDSMRERLSQKINTLKVEVDKDRFEQEVIYYLEKLDINEEKTRLNAHIEEFQTHLKNADKIEKGKLLGFIVQEMGREINTIGSKANDYNIQSLVVKMKDELEKIKEQMLNVL
jgi:uncharacterized protein (TIGR00255 family)